LQLRTSPIQPAAHDGATSDFCPRFQYAIELLGRRWVGAIVRVPLAPAPERPLPDPQKLRRFHLAELRRLATAQNAQKLDRPHTLKGFYFVHYNWMRIHKTLRVTPAMAASLTGKLMDWEDIITIMDATEKGALAQKRAAMLDELPYSNMG